VKNCTIQDIINDLVLLMAFVGNDFLPVEFCFVLKDNHMDALFAQYKKYLLEHQQFINIDGDIDWKNVSRLLKLARKF
jgi:5'-3' exonuclease